MLRCLGPPGPRVKLPGHEVMAATRYHHGDLRESAIREATDAIRRDGLEALSLRKVATAIGVSPPALYHHFRDKNDLLCAIAARGFGELAAFVDMAEARPYESVASRTRDFVHAYVRFAAENPETYDLMFGRTIWKAGTPTDDLRAVAFRTFKRYESNVGVAAGARAVVDEPARRRAQVGWAMLHGLCRLRIDGIYVDSNDLDAMTEEALRWMLAHAP